MHSNWIAFLVIWAVVEFIQWLRKRPLTQRMLEGAVWAVFLVALIALGGASKSVNTFGFFAMALVVNVAVAALICAIRLALAGGWRRLIRKSSVEPLAPQPAVMPVLGMILRVWFKWILVLCGLALLWGAVLMFVLPNK